MIGKLIFEGLTAPTASLTMISTRHRNSFARRLQEPWFAINKSTYDVILDLALADVLMTSSFPNESLTPSNCSELLKLLNDDDDDRRDDFKEKERRKAEEEHDRREASVPADRRFGNRGPVILRQPRMMDIRAAVGFGLSSSCGTMGTPTDKFVLPVQFACSNSQRESVASMGSNKSLLLIQNQQQPGRNEVTKAAHAAVAQRLKIDKGPSEQRDGVARSLRTIVKPAVSDALSSSDMFFASFFG